MRSGQWRHRLVAELVASAARRLPLASIRPWEPVVYNHFAIESDAAIRRCERERAVAAAAQLAQARPRNGRKRWSPLPHLALAALAYLRSRSAPRLPLPSWNSAEEGSNASGPWKEVPPR